jgi:hypothetical protein
MVSRNEGSNIKLLNMATSNVIDVKSPNACVPPNPEVMKTEKPQNNTIDV